MSTTLSPLAGVDNSSRILRTSIYLRNSLDQSGGQVQDLLDCVVPIVSASIDRLPEGQIVVKDLQAVIKNLFSFNIPAFSIEHVLARLAQSGNVSYEADQKAYFHAGTSMVQDTKEEETAIDKIRVLERELADYANTAFKIDKPPYFSEWADVLVYFLHPDSVEASSSVKKIKGVLIGDSDDIIRKIASTFILDCEARPDRKLFNIIVEVYGGILLGDFLQNIQTTGNPASFKNLTILYDTTILLRLLGCSGEELRNANMEMHRDLQSLGCATEFLAHNEGELANILDTIVSRYNSNLPIYGETGEALLDNQAGVQIGDLKTLQDSYPEALAALGVFPSKYTFQNTKTPNYYQIDESKFEGMLRAGHSKGYSGQNVINDTQSVAVVMRLRQSSRSYDLASSRIVFVTANTHFARVARRFVQSEEGHTSRYVSPVLTHSQISTAAWISSETKLIDSFISRELVANCMSAQQLSKEWVDGFVEILKDTTIFEENNTIVYAVRSIARDESLGNPTILRKLNPTELIRHAKAAEKARAAEAEKLHDERLRNSLVENEKQIRQEEQESFVKSKMDRSEKIANFIVRVLEFFLALYCIYVLISGLGNFVAGNILSWFQPIVFVVVTAIAVLDLFQFQPVKRLSNPLRAKLTKWIYQILYSGT